MATKYAKQTFIVVPNRNTLQIVSGLAQAVYLWLCAMQDSAGYTFPSHARLASLTNQSVRSVIRKLKELEDAGLISKSLQFGDKGQSSNLYEVLIVDVETVLEPGEGDSQSWGYDSQSPPPCHTVTPPSDSQSHRTILNRTQYKELKGHPLNAEFDDFIKMRKAIRKPATERAIELVLIRLEKLYPGDTELQRQCLNQSILNSWQGVYEIKEAEKSESEFSRRLREHNAKTNQ